MNKSDLEQIAKAVEELLEARGIHYMTEEEAERRLKELERNPKTKKTETELLRENEELKKQISELESKLSAKENLNKTKDGLCGESDLSGLTPIEVAEKLINAEAEYETNSIQRAFGADEKEKYNIFSVSELRQIAEYLLVYCNHNSENKGEV